MIDSYKFTEDGFLPCGEDEADFFDAVRPDPPEMTRLAAKFGIPPLFLSDPLDPKERPRMDQEEATTLLIIRVPVRLNGDLPGTGTGSGEATRLDHKTIGTAPLGIIIQGSKLILVAADQVLARELYGRLNRKPRPKSMLSVVFKIFIECSADFIKYLELMEELTDEAELTLSKAQQNEEIMTLLAIDKTLIHFSVALKSNRTIMEKLMDYPFLRLDTAETDLLEHALTENQQAIFMADIFGQVLGSMSDAFGTVISNNLNKVVKFLTGITIILMLPTFIVGAYGMNVVLPLEKHPLAFWVIVCLCLMSCALLWLFFRNRKWV
ncbi:MAG: magnesium transporter CorA family protein [Deltaproteobacteria bacterium]|jgi:magnesium transporter|nr:magnesium transporter CorA family protein [Deltaproteobacteria bacterium]